MKKASKSRKRINRLPSKHVTYFSCKGLAALVLRHVAFDRCLFALLARLEVLMSANYGRRLFTWDRCSFFFLYADCFCIECVLFFFTLLLLCLSLNSKIFILRRWIASFLVCFTRSGASVTESSCTIKITEKKIKKRWKATARNAFFRNGILHGFLFLSMVQHCCFCRMQTLGNGINWKKIHSPGIKHFLSHAFSLFTGLVLEGFTWDKIGKCQSASFCVFPFLFFFFFF